METNFCNIDFTNFLTLSPLGIQIWEFPLSKAWSYFNVYLKRSKNWLKLSTDLSTSSLAAVKEIYSSDCKSYVFVYFST